MADRTYNKIDSRLYMEDWSNGAKLIAGILFAMCPNQYGIYDTPIWVLQRLWEGLYTRDEIEGYFTELEGYGVIKFYNDRKIIWIVKKWKREQKNPSALNMKGAENFLKDCCDAVSRDFLNLYKPLATPLQPPSKGKRNPAKDILSTDTDTDTDTDKKKKDIPTKNAVASVLKLFPDMEIKRIDKQALALDKIKRLDNPPADIMDALVWAIGDDEFWKYNFKSCIPLRHRMKNDCLKWENIYSAYQKYQHNGKMPTRQVTKYKCDRCGHLYDYQIDACSTMTCLEHTTHSFTPTKVEVEE